MREPDVLKEHWEMFKDKGLLLPPPLLPVPQKRPRGSFQGTLSTSDADTTLYTAFLFNGGLSTDQISQTVLLTSLGILC